MDSLTSLVVLVGAIAFIAAWCAIGRRFSYVGLQIALAFYFVAFQGFGPPMELAPARDRFVGILVALVVMWFVFDLIWPVRTVTIMRRNLASIFRSDAALLELGLGGESHSEQRRQANALRDQVGKIVAGLRTMNDAVEYELGADRELAIHSSQAIVRAGFTAVAIFWNHLAPSGSPQCGTRGVSPRTQAERDEARVCRGTEQNGGTGNAAGGLPAGAHGRVYRFSN